MNSVKDTSKDGISASQDCFGGHWLPDHTIQCPGLSPGAEEIRFLAEDIPKRLAIFSYKQFMPNLWVVFIGGTGTGKSTLFNAFCGRPLSETGVERPKTSGPIAYAHRDSPIEKDFPLPSIQIERRPDEDFHSRPAAGMPGHLLILEHDRKDMSHLVVVDTPDLDSVEAQNRQIAEDLYLMADAVVFLTSQEKYADEVPYQFLLRALQEKNSYFLLLNKADEQFSEEELLETLQRQGTSFRKDRIWLITYSSSHPSQWISDDRTFRDFVHRFSEEFSKEETGKHRAVEYTTLSRALKAQIGRLLDLLQQETREAQRWSKQLESLYQKASQDLIKEEKERFTAESQEYLRTEIRRLFAKYDVLARPRQFITNLFLMPLRFIGLRKQGIQDTHRKALLRVRRKIDLTPIYSTIEKFNRSVLEGLSPSDENSPLFGKIRQSGVMLRHDEIKDTIWKEQDRLLAWLEETFQRLSLNIPKRKKWGIYTTSVLWGILILSFEITIGGGFTVLDALLDTALAPFVTKGAVELFAYHEIQKIARELGKRYQEGLLSVVRRQRDLYGQCLESLETPEEDLESLKVLYSRIQDQDH